MTRVHIPRNSKRHPLALAVQCRTQSGMRDTGEISDLSAQGCCLRLRGLHFRVGTRLILRPEGLEAFSGAVRWLRGDLAGIEFDRPLYTPVVEYLAARHGIAAEGS